MAARAGGGGLAATIRAALASGLRLLLCVEQFEFIHELHDVFFEMNLFNHARVW